MDETSWDDPVFLEEVLAEGSLTAWRELYLSLEDQPFGPSAQALQKVLAATKIYGAVPLWKGILGGLQGVTS